MASHSVTGHPTLVTEVHMIATLHGKLQSRTDDALIVNVGGVGFRVRVLDRHAGHLGAVGSDGSALYAFARPRRRTLVLRIRDVRTSWPCSKPC